MQKRKTNFPTNMSAKSWAFLKLTCINKCSQVFVFFFFLFLGSDIVQWLIKNLTIEDPGK